MIFSHYMYLSSTGAYDVLKKGGEFYFSDVYCNRRLPKHVQEHEVLWGECVAGAMYTQDFIRAANKGRCTNDVC